MFQRCELPMRSVWGLAVVALMGSFSNVIASNGSVDQISIATISAQGSSSGITFASSVYIAAGSSLTLQGSGGYVVLGSSVNASEFFGDGHSLSGVAVLSSTQTFSGGATFVSSLTVQSSGQPIVLATGPAVNNLAISSAGIVTFSPLLHNSSATIVPSATTTSGSLGPCVSGSTITITTTGGKVEVVFIGDLSTTITSGNAAPAAKLTFLQDGAFVRDFSTTKGAIQLGELTAATITLKGSGYFNYLLDPPSPGVHSYCLSLAVRNAVNGNSATLDTSNSGNLFYVVEIK